MLHGSPLIGRDSEEVKDAKMDIVDIQLITEETPQRYNPKTIEALQNSLMHLARDRLMSGNTSDNNDTVESFQEPVVEKPAEVKKQSFAKTKQITLSVAKSTQSLKPPVTKLQPKGSNSKVRLSTHMTPASREYQATGVSVAATTQANRKAGARKLSR